MTLRRRKAAKVVGKSAASTSATSAAIMNKQAQQTTDPPFYLRRYPMLLAAILFPALSVLLARGTFRRGNVVNSEGVKGTPSSGGTSTRTSTEPTPSARDAVEAIYVGDAYDVLATYPHDPGAFTQGLTYFGGRLYEGTGDYGDSELRELEMIPKDGDVTGSIRRSTKLDGKYFGEGIAHYHDANGNERIIQITWKEQTGFIYDAKTFEVLKEFRYESKTNEGWGITYDASKHEFIVSDGSDYIFFWDRDTLQEKRRVQVTLRQLLNNGDDDEEPEISKRPVQHINELEMVNGLVFANIWYQNVLVAIDPVDGQVVKVYDFSKLYTKRSPDADCFNGISVTDTKNELLVTGKNWPSMYRIKLLR
jgi:glutamine cyclotransferase